MEWAFDNFAKVPITLRNFAISFFKNDPLKSLGIFYYQVVRNCVARAFKCDEVSQILYRGREVKTLIPALSDLDFILMSKYLALEEEARFWIKLRKKYQSLKRIFLIPGEIEIKNEKIWNLFTQVSPASILWYTKTSIWSNNEWSPIQLNPRAIKPSSRFALCLEHLTLSLSHFRTKKQNSYTRYSYLREVSKSIDYSFSNSFKVYWNTPPNLLLKNSHLSLNQLALKHTPNPPLAFSVEISESESSPKDIEHETSRTLLSKEWFKRFLKFTNSPLKETSIPFFFETHETLDESFFERYFLFSKSSKIGQLGVLFLYPSMLSLYLRGFSWGEPLQNMSRIKQHLGMNYLNSVKEDMYCHLFERAVTHLNAAFGQILYANKNKLKTTLLHLCWEGMVIHTRLLTQNIRELIHLSEKTLLHTSALATTLLNEQALEIHEGFLKKAILSRNELVELLSNTYPKLYST